MKRFSILLRIRWERCYSVRFSLSILIILLLQVCAISLLMPIILLLQVCAKKYIMFQVFPLKAELLKPQEQMERHITDLVKKVCYEDTVNLTVDFFFSYFTSRLSVG